MFVYELVFLISTLLMWLGHRSKRKIFFWSMLACIIVIMFYAFADYTVINDRAGYATLLWRRAVAFRGHDFSWIEGSGDMEKGYLFLNFLISKFTNSISIFFLVYGFLQVYCIYISINLLKDLISVPLSWWIYLHLMFIPVMAQIRQGLAVSFAVLVFSLLLVKKLKTASILFFLVLLVNFHDTFAVTIFYFLFFIITKAIKKNLATTLIISPVSLLLIPMFARRFFPKLASRYLESGSQIMQGQLVVTALLMILLLWLTFKDKFKQESHLVYVRDSTTTFEERMFIISSAFAFYILLLQSFMSQAYRLREYFLIGFVIGFGYYSKKNFFSKIYIILIIVCVLTYVWLIYYSKNYSNLFPYNFMIDN